MKIKELRKYGSINLINELKKSIDFFCECDIIIISIEVWFFCTRSNILRRKGEF